jgi:Peptidase M61 N-terminal domain
MLLMAAVPALAAQPAISYSLDVDAANLSVLNVTMHVQNAPETSHIGMARHPEYDDRFWRYMEGLQIDTAPGPASVGARRRSNAAVSNPAVCRRPFRASGVAPIPDIHRRACRDLHTFLYIMEEPHAPSHVRLRLPAGWSVATALAPTSDPNVFFAASGDILAESPILVGRLRDWRFVVNDTRHPGGSIRFCCRTARWARSSIPTHSPLACRPRPWQAIRMRSTKKSPMSSCMRRT